MNKKDANLPRVQAMALTEYLQLDDIPRFLDDITQLADQPLSDLDSDQLIRGQLRLIGVFEVLYGFQQEADPDAHELHAQVKHLTRRTHLLWEHLVQRLEALVAVSQPEPSPAWASLPPAKTYDRDLATRMVELGYFKSVDEAMVEMTEEVLEELGTIKKSQSAKYRPATLWRMLPPIFTR